MLVELHQPPNVRYVCDVLASSDTAAPFFSLRQGPGQVQIHKSKVYEGITKDQKEAVLLLDPVSTLTAPICGRAQVDRFELRHTCKLPRTEVGSLP